VFDVALGGADGVGHRLHALVDSSVRLSFARIPSRITATVSCMPTRGEPAGRVRALEV
jgi:hypothetical protein